MFFQIFLKIRKIFLGCNEKSIDTGTKVDNLPNHNNGQVIYKGPSSQYSQPTLRHI